MAIRTRSGRRSGATALSDSDDEEGGAGNSTLKGVRDNFVWKLDALLCVLYFAVIYWLP